MTILDKIDRVEYLLKHMPGRHDQQKHAGSRVASVDAEFANSPVGSALNALADEYDFVVFGSAAMRLHLGDGLGRLPNDIDVIDFRQKVPNAQLSGRFEHLDDPRVPMNPHWVDDKTGVKISTYDAGQVMDTISGMRAPSLKYDYATEEYKLDKIGKFTVLPLDHMIEAKLWGRDQDLVDVERAIASKGLSRDYIDDSRYQRLWDMGDWREYQ